LIILSHCCFFFYFIVSITVSFSIVGYQNSDRLAL
jgi:hypothetical protein